MEEEKQKEKSHIKKRKITSKLVILVILIIISGYFLSRGMGQQFEKEEVIIEDLLNIKRAHLFRAGTDGEPGPRNEGEVVEVFNPGDLFGLSGEYEVKKESYLTAHIFTEDEIIRTENALSPLNAGTTDGTSGFSMCCGQVPSDPDSYYIEILIDGERDKLLPFEVVE